MNTIAKEVEITFEEYNRRQMDMSRYITSDGSGNYHCSLCDETWRGYKRYLYWPIAIHWQRKASHKFINWHGWQLGYEKIQQRVFGWTLHIGALKICFGSVSRLREITRYTYKSEPTAPATVEDDVLSASFISEIEQ